MCDNTRLANALTGKQQRNGGMNKQELLTCAISRGLDAKKNMTRPKLISLFNPPAEKRVSIPQTIQDVVKILPKLKREYGGIIDFKLNGSFEAMSMIPGEATTVKGTDIPDYEVMWHNHPKAQEGYISLPSFADAQSLILRKHTQYSLIFTDIGTFIQWTPDRYNSKQHLKLFRESAKNLVSVEALYDSVTHDSASNVPFMEQFISGVKNFLAVETLFVPWGQGLTFKIYPYEPTVHRGRLTKAQKAKFDKP